MGDYAETKLVLEIRFILGVVPESLGRMVILFKAGTGNGLLKPSAQRKKERHDNTSSVLRCINCRG